MKKVITFFLSIGAYHLFIYCSSNNIPISIDLLTTTSTLLIFGISTTLTAIMIGVTPCLLLAVTSAAQESPLYQKYFFARKNYHQSQDTVKKAYANCLYLFAIPLSIFFLYFWKYETTKDYLSVGNFLLLLIAEILFSTLIMGKIIIYKNRNFLLNDTENNKVKSKIYITIIALKISWIFSLFFLILWATSIFGQINETALASIIIVMTLINGIFLIPVKNKNEFQKNDEKYSNKNLIIKAIDSIYAPSLFFLISVMAILLFHPLMVEKTSATTLKMLKIGGGTERRYHFNNSNEADIPAIIIESCNTGKNCQTTAIEVLFDVGNILYIKGPDSKIYSVPRDKLWTIIEQQQKL